MPAIERSGLLTTDIEVLRLHYAETLRHWRRRFATNRDTIASLYDERFCRMFEFYLSSCELGFRYGSLAVFQIQLAHQQTAVPLTRDYITKIPFRAKQVNTASVSGLQARRAPNESEIWPTTAVLPD